MKISRNILQWRGFAAAGFACAFLLQTSCEDDPMGKHSGEMTDHPVFSVDVRSNWVAGTVMGRSGDTDIEIDATDCKAGGKPLWLVTEISSINDSVAAGGAKAASRGTAVTTATFGSEFGLSAICYNGEAGADLSGWEANFASNDKVTQSGGVWSSSTRELDWMGSGRLRFFAYAPYEATGLTASPLKLGLTVSADISKQIDLLTATADCDATGGAAVELGFGHALAAVTVKSGDAMLAGEVTKVTVSGVYASGEYDMLSGKWTPVGNADASFATADGFSMKLGENTDNGDSYPYTKPGGNITGSGDGLTLFMIPQSLGTGAKLSIEFTDNLSGTSSTLEASIGGSGKSWEAGKLYSYALSTSGIVVTPVVELKNSRTGADLSNDADSVSFAGVIKNVSLRAYVRITKPGSVTVDKAVPFSIQTMASTDEAGNSWPATWSAGVFEPDPDSGVYAAPASVADEGDGPKTRKGRLVLTEQGVFNDMREKLITRSKIDGGSYTSEGSESNPYDLSQGGETANCYMVNKPGYYKIPLYYGNQTGTQPMPTDKEPGMKWYVDHNNNKITAEKISEHIATYGLTLKDALVLWQDSPGLVDNVKLLNNDYLVFRISPYTLSQGNAVIALRDNKNDIAWSWHIWATHYDWSQTAETNATDSEGTTYTFRFPKSTLGYCDAHEAAASRKVRFRVLFDLRDVSGDKLAYEPMKDGAPMKWGQRGVIKSMAGDNAYFQWGRKDPFPGGIYDKVSSKAEGHTYYTPQSDFDTNEFTMLNKPIFDEPDDNDMDSEGHVFKFMRPEIDGGINIAQAVKHPNWFPRGTGGDSDSNRRHWHTRDISELTYIDNDENASFYNAWNRAATSNGVLSTKDPKNAQPVQKTIYDPSPAGFCVPPVIAFMGFVEAGVYNAVNQHPSNPISWSDNDRCWQFHCNEDGTGEIMRLYAVGLRDMSPKIANIPLMPSELDDTSTWAAYSMVTYISSATLVHNGDKNTGYQVAIMYLDNRIYGSFTFRCGAAASSQNAYGMSVWPVKIN